MKQIKPPVLVKERTDGRLSVREVRDVETAGEIHRSWPGRGRAWRQAAEAIADALRGEETPDAARKAFVAAAREAGVLIERED